MILTSIREQHPFVYAKERFLAGEMLVDQAIAMVMRDTDFEYNVLVHQPDRFNGIKHAAECVVREVWCKELCEIIAQRKRGLALLG